MKPGLFVLGLSLTALGLGIAQSNNAAQVTVPSGFAVSIFQAGLGGPRMMVFGPDGKLYVSLMGSGKIVRMSVEGGRAGPLETLKSGLFEPHGLAWYKDGSSQWLYLAEETQIQRFKLVGDSLGSGQVLINNLPRGGHITRTIHFGPDGKMYVAIGSGSNKSDESDPRRAAILRYNPDGSIPADNPFVHSADPRQRAVWAEGLRNAVDFLWTPSGQLWASTQGSDNVVLKPGDPPDLEPYEKLVNLVEKGKNYGWPYCIPAKLGVNTPTDLQIPDPTTQASNPGRFDCAKAIPPLFTTVAHAAPLGMAWGSSSNFPAAYKNSLYIALHGSWNTNNPANYRDCKVERVVLENGLPVRSEPFAVFKRGFDQRCGEAWGRPADVVFGPDGSMYISDDQGGRILRVVYTGG